ncbi:DsrE family protein [Pedobacter agri]|uniref:DsrE family protein n=1 Tax=Pedobacter agri TaxID=454586 RepID=A0A9X3I8P2_9SPHI|nr:DsrE family protein [Pedobacter agri]MCX3264194.1 DsrE family protein [Pedobacter agri]
MKKIIYLMMLTTLATLTKVKAQQPAEFTGAKATLKHYNALYIVNTADEKRISGTLRNIKNALEDPRLKGKLTVEIIAFGDGVKLFDKTAAFQDRLQSLKDAGVILAQCENTIKERNINKDQLLPIISYVPSGNGEIIIRQYQGWATVHP